MDRVDQLGPGNYILTGDFNVDDSFESSFQELINHSNPAINFYDPLNQLGVWHVNSSFAGIHTQSTRSSNTNSGCFAGGGMDDRFDFLLSSNDALNGYKGVQYVPASALALGQDGTFYNQEMPQTGNLLVPDSVSISLYNMSDHLPVLADFEVGPMITEVSEIGAASNDFVVSTMVYDNLYIRSFKDQDVTLTLMDMNGRTVLQQDLRFTAGQLQTIKAPIGDGGLYLVVLAGPLELETHKVLVVK